MDAKFQRRIQRYGWDKAADAYEAGWRDSLAPAQTLLLEAAAAQPGERVLETACGTGLVTFPLAEAVGPTGCVIATDISQRMIDILDRESVKREVRVVHAQRADAEALDEVADNSVDLAVCALGFMYYPEPEAALAEMMRVLKPGGRAVIAVWGARKNCGWAEIFPIVDARVQSAVCPMFFQLGTGGALADKMAGAGFTAISDDRISALLPYANDDAACDAAFAGGPVALAYSRFDQATRAAAHAEYLASIAAFRTRDGYRIPGEFVVVSARKPA